MPAIATWIPACAGMSGAWLIVARFSAILPREENPMTQRPTDNGNHVGLAPPDEPVGAGYQRDFYSWLMEQARRVREGRWDRSTGRTSRRRWNP